MIQKLILLGAIFTSTIWGYSSLDKKKGLLFDIELVYKQNFKKVKLKNKFILAEGTQNWVTLIPPSKGVIVLGRPSQLTQDTLKMEYILIDTTSKKETVSSTPVMVIKLDEKEYSKLIMEGDKQTFSIALKAENTTYQ